MDLSTLLGVALGLGGIVVGNALEGGHFGSLVQFTAAVIVFGGTFGATLVANTPNDIKLGFSYLKKAFLKENHKEFEVIAREINECALLARKESLLSLERKLNQLSHPFMKNVFRFMIDGVDGATLRDIFENEITLEESRRLRGAKVWSDAGGYAPTIGILGAVLGLIHVMANLTDTSALGQGIAVAFVATIYGVGSANLMFIPIANKIRQRIEAEAEVKFMILEGALSIVSGLNPYIVQEKMRNYSGQKMKVEAAP